MDKSTSIIVILYIFLESGFLIVLNKRDQYFPIYVYELSKKSLLSQVNHCASDTYTSEKIEVIMRNADFYSN
jgi:hypothetical protein